MNRLMSICIFLMPTLMYAQVSATQAEIENRVKKGRIDTFISSTGEIFSVNDTITLGVAFRGEQFDHVHQDAGIDTYPVPNSYAHSRVRIKKIIARSKQAIIYTTAPSGMTYGLVVIKFDIALKNGEVVSGIMTSDEALDELKKWKDKLDLELITEAEYNAKKTELSKLIK